MNNVLNNKNRHIPDGWKIAPLRDLVDSKRGISYGVVQPGSGVDDGVPIIRVNNIKNNHLLREKILRIDPSIEAYYQRTRLTGGEVLLTIVGSIGEVVVAPEDVRGWNVARAVAVIPILPEINPKWIAYCLQSPLSRHYFQMWATTTAQATLNLSDLKNIPIPLPPIEEREVITNTISSLDEKIELNSQMNETLESIARTIFKSWFMDFDPVRAKAEGKQPFGMDEETAALFPSEFEDSEIGEIPKGWKITSIADVAELNSFTLRKNDVLDRIDYIEISEVSRGEIHKIQTYRRGEEPGRARRRLRHGDTVLSTVRPDRGSYFLCLNPSRYLVSSTGFSVVTPIRAPWSFIHCSLTQPSIFEYFGQQADGGAYPAIRPDVIGSLRIVIPDNKAVLNKFHDIVAPLLEMADANRKQSKTLANLRDALLPKLLSGELRVSGDQVSNLQARLDAFAPTE